MNTKYVEESNKEFLSDFGFQFDPKSLYHFKPIPGGRQIIFSHYHPYEEVFYLEYQLGIRLDEVEHLVHKFLPSISDYKNRSITLVETMDKVDDQMPRRFLLESEEEIGKVLQNSETFLVKKGFNWLDTMSVPIHLEDHFNQNPKRQISTQNFTYRSSRGVVLSSLFHAERYEAVKKEYLGLLHESGVTPFTLACFINLLNELEGR